MIELVAAFLGGGALAALVNFIGDRRRNKTAADLDTVQAAASVVKLYGQALQDVQEKVRELQGEVKWLRGENQELRLEVQQLHQENQRLRTPGTNA